MSLFIVKDENGTEVNSYTNPNQAENLAHLLTEATCHTHTVEHLVIPL